MRVSVASKLLGRLAGCVLVFAVGCDPRPPEEGPPPPFSSQHPIVGGARAATCQWPTAVGADGCTSTLVHPRVITTADHCVRDGGPAEITFGETWAGRGVARRVAVERCWGADADASGIPGDFGFCVLAGAVEDVPIVPILYGCETAALAPGARAVLVGYGRRGGFSFFAGTKYFVDVALGAIDGNDIFLGDARRGGCHGDSGGPAYLRLADGTWRVFGATSRGSFFCNNQTIYTLIHPFVHWMETTSGIDVTPCHDAASGTWSPGPDCGGFPIDPGAGGGSWSAMCGDGPGGARGGPGATCGPPA